MTIVPSKNEMFSRTLDRMLSVQRPVVLAHIRGIRKGKPGLAPADVIRILERRYLAAVTTGGALVGASSAIPAVGTVASVALSAAETAGFLEASALFAQSVTEVHGIALNDPERSRTLVMALILGGAGSELVEQLAGEVVGGAPTRTAFWGEMVTKNLPKSAVGGVAKRMRSYFIKRFAAREGANIIGRAIPFGIGAVIGGAGNNLLGRRVISSSRTAFGPAPAEFPLILSAHLAPAISPQLEGTPLPPPL
ncbi:MAG: hypothetical protein QOH44_1674 [Actinomycetota bacterium]|nr:hypothetical protein [Actinomycetota bacterium]